MPDTALRYEITVPMVPNRRGKLEPPLSENYRLHHYARSERVMGIRSVVAWVWRDTLRPAGGEQ